MALSETIARASWVEPGAPAPARDPRIVRAERHEKVGLLLLAAPALTILFLVLIVPLVWIVVQSFIAGGRFSFANYARILADYSYLNAFWLTVRVALLVTAICALLGYVLAYALTLMPPWLRVVGLALVTLPFWTSALVRTYAWLVLLQTRGVVNKLLLQFGLTEEPIRMVYNLTGTLVGMTHILLPFMLFPLYAVLTRIDRDYMRAAMGLGATPTYAFWRVYFPLSLPGLVAGVTIVFILALGFYITPALLGGGRVIMMSLVIEKDAHVFMSWGPASANAVVFVAAIGVLLALVSRVASLERVFGR